MHLTWSQNQSLHSGEIKDFKKNTQIQNMKNVHVAYKSNTNVQNGKILGLGSESNQKANHIHDQ